MTLLAELVRLGALGFDQVFEDVVAQRFADDIIPLHLIDRFTESGGQGGEIAAAEIVIGEGFPIAYQIEEYAAAAPDRRT